MSDWDFLHDMHDEGYSSAQIAEAAACGYNPWQKGYLSREWIESELEGEPEDDAFSVEPAEVFRSRDGLPFSTLEQAEIFHDIVDCARRHFENTGRYLQIWGELGEIYAEIKYGLRRHATHAPGSDGTIQGKLVEVKTISPEKSGDRISVKSQGNFEQLLVVKIDEDFLFRSKLFNRHDLKGNGGPLLWTRFKNDAGHTEE